MTRRTLPHLKSGGERPKQRGERCRGPEAGQGWGLQGHNAHVAVAVAGGEEIGRRGLVFQDLQPRKEWLLPSTDRA